MAEDEVARQRWVRQMETDFSPGYTREAYPDAQHRVANALEYIAYQLGQINRKLDKLTAE